MSKNRYLGRFYYFFRHKKVFFIGQSPLKMPNKPNEFTFEFVWFVCFGIYAFYYYLRSRISRECLVVSD